MEAEAANGAGVLTHQIVVVPLRRFEWEAGVVKPRYELVDGVPDGGKPNRVLGGATAAAGYEIAKILDIIKYSTFVQFDGAPRCLTYPKIDEVDVSVKREGTVARREGAGVLPEDKGDVATLRDGEIPV